MAQPTTMTVNSGLMQLLSQLLGMNTSDPMGMQISQSLLNYLKGNLIPGMTGISPSSPIWNAVLYSNMTNFGITMQNMNASANAIGAQAMLQMQADTRYQLIDGWQRLVTSEKAFQNMTEEQRGGYKADEYEKFIKWKSQGMMDNPLLSMALTAWDPTGKMMASLNMRQASANIARNAMWRGDENYARKAEAVADMFLNEDYVQSYKKSDYGMFSLNETTALTAALTKNLNFAAGINDEAGVQKAAEDLRNRVQRMTKAMSPLKDFFGDDVPNMIRFLEDITGKSIQQLDTKSIHDLTRRVANNVATGVYTMEQYQALSTQLYGSVGQMNTGFYMNPGVGAMSDKILAAVGSGYTPLMESQSSFQQGVAERTMRHAGSQFANNVNLAYAVWAQKGGAGGDKEFSTFERMFNTLTQGDNAISASRALLELADEANMTQVTNKGYRSAFYSEASKNGLGGRMAQQEDIKKKFDTFIWQFGTEKEQQAAIRLRNKILDQNSELDMDALTRSIMEGTDENEKAVLNLLQQDQSYRALNLDAAAYRQQQVASAKETRAAEIRSRVEFIDEMFGDAAAKPGSIMEGVANVLFNNGKFEGLDAEFRKQYSLTSIQDLTAKLGIEEEDKQMLSAIWNSDRTESTRAVAINEYLKNKAQDPKRNQYLQDIYWAQNGETFNFATKLSTSTLKVLTGSEEGMQLLANTVADKDTYKTDAAKEKVIRDFVAERAWNDDEQKELNKAKKAVLNIFGQDKEDQGQKFLNSFFNDVVKGGMSEKQFLEKKENKEVLDSLVTGDKESLIAATKQLATASNEVTGAVMKESSSSDPAQALREIFGNGKVFTDIGDVLTKLNTTLEGLMHKLGFGAED